MTDPEKMALKGAEYSPLNNLSSGEEVEQFALPHPAPDRPKRRRKRKDFDTLKASAVNTVRRNPVCSCCTCLSILMFVLLSSVMIGLAFTCMNLLQHVEEMQTELDNLKQSKRVVDTKLTSIETLQESDQSKLQNLTNHIHNMTNTLAKVSENLSKLKGKVDSIKVDHEQRSGEAAIKALSEQIATSGSDIASLRSDVLALKQNSQTQSDLTEELQTKISNLISSDQTMKSPSDSSDGSADSADLSQKFTALNMTVSSKLSTFTDVLTQYNTRYEQKVLAIDELMEDVNDLMKQVRQNVSSWLSTESVAVGADNSTALDDQEDKDFTEEAVEEASLTDRVDKLESFVHQVSLQLQDKIVSETDSKVVNLTITSGMEDIINRAFDTRYGELKDNLDELKVYIGTNKAELSALDQRFNSITQKVFELHSVIENLDKQTPPTVTTELENATVTVSTPSPSENATVELIVPSPADNDNDHIMINETVSTTTSPEDSDNNTVFLDIGSDGGNITITEGNGTVSEPDILNATLSTITTEKSPNNNGTIADMLQGLSDDSLMKLLNGLREQEGSTPILPEEEPDENNHLQPNFDEEDPGFGPRR